MKNKRGIPAIRKRLYELADEHKIDELRDLASEMHRNSPIKKAMATSTPMNPALANNIRLYARQNPDLSQRHIAEHFNVNPGRVSESLNGLH